MFEQEPRGGQRAFAGSVYAGDAVMNPGTPIEGQFYGELRRIAPPRGESAVEVLTVAEQLHQQTGFEGLFEDGVQTAVQGRLSTAQDDLEQTEVPSCSHAAQDRLDREFPKRRGQAFVAVHATEVTGIGQGELQAREETILARCLVIGRNEVLEVLNRLGTNRG